MRDRRFPGVSKYKDRHSRWRWRARAKGKPSVELHGNYASPQFVAEWHAWVNGRVEVGKDRTAPGTIDEAIVSFYKSDTFKALSANTQKAYRAMIERFRAKNGKKGREHLNPDEIRKIRNKLKPEPSNMLLRCLRALCRHAVDEHMLKSDPTAGMKKRKNPLARKDGIHTWTLDEIAKYEAKHALGTRARLALDLMLYTAQRRSDIVTFGRQHETNGGNAIRFRQQKTGEWLELPIVAPLRASIEATKTGDLTYLETMRGQPFSAAGFGNWFRDRCNDAGLPQCSAHGLRKATATRLADAGATPHQIMAITGHRSLSEVENYTRKANKARLARQMADVLAGSKDELEAGEPANRDPRFAIVGRKGKQYE